MCLMRIAGLDHVAISVADVEESAQWYCDVLGLERQHPGMWGGTPVFVGNDHASVALFPLKERAESRPPGQKGRHGGRPSILHFAFRTSRDDFEAAQRGLRERGIAFEFEDHEITHSIYFHDPDGHKIELTTHDL